MGVILIVLFSLILGQMVSTNKYCDPSLCKLYQPNGEYINVEHVACNNTGKFSDKCIGHKEIIPMTDVWKAYITTLHNRIRNMVAGGKLKGYKMAKQMPMVKWDNELAHLAELNIKSCEMKHDACRNTKKHPYAGQNLGYYGDYSKYLKKQDSIQKIISYWFNEHRLCNMKFINEYHLPEKNVIGHFTVMINDHVTHIGCGLLKFEKLNDKDNKVYKTHMLACNYSYTNINGQPVYRPGKYCSGCRNGCNKIYPALCQID